MYTIFIFIKCLIVKIKAGAANNIKGEKSTLSPFPALKKEKKYDTSVRYRSRILTLE